MVLVYHLHAEMIATKRMKKYLFLYVPNRFEYGGKRGNSNSSPNKDARVVLEVILEKEKKLRRTAYYFMYDVIWREWNYRNGGEI